MWDGASGGQRGRHMMRVCNDTPKMAQTGRRGEACFSLSALFASLFSRRPLRAEEQPLQCDSPASPALLLMDPRSRVSCSPGAPPLAPCIAGTFPLFPPAHQIPLEKRSSCSACAGQSITPRRSAPFSCMLGGLSRVSFECYDTATGRSSLPGPSQIKAAFILASREGRLVGREQDVLALNTRLRQNWGFLAELLLLL